MTYNTLLCFDYGTKRIGVAVGQSITCTASPLEIVRVINTKPDWLHISKLIKEWHPDAIIVGFPVKMDNSYQSITIEVEKFIRQLQNRYNLPVHEIDERMSTYEAKQRINDENQHVDHIAAQAILETWFSENNAGIKTR